ncbi:sensor histidine kinase [Odoribacter lunatus]|uniref:sensor histidine kinase n=1 Tax=Odoribacter lunatus TaxID=2941335 RepID=UPI00203EB031|nr:HAMP domain-containing sensor histidine kinase [Odoribacter lunatus]
MRKKQIIVLGIVLGLSLLGLIFMQAHYFQTAFRLRKAQFDYTVNRSLTEAIAYIEEKDKMSEKEEEFQENEINAEESYKQIGTGNEIIVGRVLSLIDYEEGSIDGGDYLGKQSNTGFQTSLLKFRQAIKEQLGTDFDLVVAKKFQDSERTVEERIKGMNLKNILSEHLRNNGIKIDFEFAIKEKDHFIVMSQCFFNRHSDYTFTRKMYFGGTQGQATLYLIFADRMYDTFSSILLLLPSLIITLLLVLCFVFCLVVIIRQKKLSAIKNDFINNMTHEFKTPIATISLAAQMLKDGAVQQTPDTIEHIAGIIRDESKRLTFQVEKVLQTALFTETRMKLKLKNVNLNEIIEGLLMKFSLRIQDKGGKLLGHLDAERDEIFADEVHITNVFSNLLDNAIKYCVKIPEISVYTRNKGDEMIVSVIDNGIGIATKEQKLIFERFYRISTGNLHDVKGFGLGLSYVKKIVEAHGGRIEVDSALDKGSRFDIILPLISKKQKVKRTLFF